MCDPQGNAGGPTTPGGEFLFGLGSEAGLPPQASNILATQNWDRGDPGIAGGIGARAAGSGVGGILGTIGALALAPETGGLSLGALAAMGALSGLGGNLLGDLFSGSGVDPLSLVASGVGGGITGGIGGELSGAAGGVAEGATGGATPAAIASPFGSDVGETVVPDFAGTAAGAAAAPAVSSAPALTGGGDLAGSVSGSALATQPTFGAGPGGVTAASGTGPTIDQEIADWSAMGGPAASPAGGLTGDPSVVGPAQAAVDKVGGVGYDPTTGTNWTKDGSGVLGDIQKWLGKNRNLVGPASLLASLGKSALFPSKIPGQDMLNSNAGLARNIAETNANGLNPAQQALSQQQLNGQIAAIKAKYAQLGLSGSTAEQQDIAHIQNANLAASSQAISQNTNTALNAVGVANASTLPIAQQQLQDDKSLSEAIALLAAMSLYGGAGAGQGSA